MSAQVVSFDVTGWPAPQGSKRAFRHAKSDKVIMVEQSKRLAPWRHTVATCAIEAMDGLEMFKDTALHLGVAFRFTRPMGHWGKSGLRPSARIYPSVMPDLSKLIRAVEDALTGVVWDDDARVVAIRAIKRYALSGEGPGAEIVVMEFKE